MRDKTPTEQTKERHVHVDRVACPWLISRSIDRQFEVYDALHAWCRFDVAKRDG